MKAYVERVDDLRCDDWSPVRSASAIAPFGDGWLIAQDDATHAAWRRGNLLAGLPSASVDVPVAQPVAVLPGALAPADVAVVDGDDPLVPSLELSVRVDWKS
jgi:hypothetical protein